VATGGNLIDPTGIAVDAAGQLLVADYGDEGETGSVVRVDPATGAQTVVAIGQLVDPYAIAIASDGTTVVSELGYAKLSEPALLRLDPDNGILTFISTAGQLQDPFGVAFDAAGNLIVADADPAGGKILRVDPLTGQQTVLFEDPAFAPFGVTVVVPEPTTMLLPTAALLLARRRRGVRQSPAPRCRWAV
jgi:DNA-binding beta-propeller fold protein YncE